MPHYISDIYIRNQDHVPTQSNIHYITNGQNNYKHGNTCNKMKVYSIKLSSVATVCPEKDSLDSYCSNRSASEVLYFSLYPTACYLFDY